MLLIQDKYPTFLGKNRQSRKASVAAPTQIDSGVDSETKSKDEDQ